jgi:hypothetical protein
MMVVVVKDRVEGDGSKVVSRSCCWVVVVLLGHVEVVSRRIGRTRKCKKNEARLVEVDESDHVR